MEENKINALMDMTVSKIRQLVDADTIIGKPISTPDGITVIPVSRMSFGIGTGGTTGSKGISFTGGNGETLTAYINRMNDQLRFVLSHLDGENMTDEYEQTITKQV